MMRRVIVAAVCIGAAGLGATLVEGSGGSTRQTVYPYVGSTVIMPTGSTGSTATAITTQYNYINDSATSGGIRLPAATGSGVPYTIASRLFSYTISIYPAPGEKVGHSASAGVPMSIGGVASVTCFDRIAGQWDCTTMPIKNSGAAGAGVWLDGGLGLYGGLTVQTGNIEYGGAAINFQAATTHTILDNSATSYCIKQSTNTFLCYETLNGAELITHAKPMRGTIATPIAAAGTDITNCAAIPAGTVWVHVTANDGAKGVCLPTTTSVTTCVQIMAETAATLLTVNSLKVYGADADTTPTVNGGAGDAAYLQLGGTSLTYCNSGVAWTSY